MSLFVMAVLFGTIVAATGLARSVAWTVGVLRDDTRYLAAVAPLRDAAWVEWAVHRTIGRTVLRLGRSRPVWTAVHRVLHRRRHRAGVVGPFVVVGLAVAGVVTGGARRGGRAARARRGGQNSGSAVR